MDSTVAGPSTAQEASTSLPETTPTQPTNNQKDWTLFDKYPEQFHFCNDCQIWCNFCNYNFEINPEMLELEGKSLQVFFNRDDLSL